MTVNVAPLPEFSDDGRHGLWTNVKHELVGCENKYVQIITHFFIQTVWHT